MAALSLQWLFVVVPALGISLKQHPLEPEPQVSTAYFWAGKNGDAWRTGTSSFAAPRQLGNGPSWSFHENEAKAVLLSHPDLLFRFPKFKGLTRAAPLIDDKRNIYLSTVTMGNLYKFSPDGQLIWKYGRGDLQQQLPGIPSLMEGRLFTANTKGEVLAVDMETGKLLWSTKIADSIAGDTWSMAASDGIVIAPAVHGAQRDNTRLVALRARDGSQVWTFDSDVVIYNLLVSIRDGSCVFSTCTGDAHRLDLQTGRPIWGTPRPQKPDFSTGGSVVGSDGVVYTTWNERSQAGKEGWVGAFRFSDGRSLWRTKVGYEANNAPAVGKLGRGPNAGLSVVVGIGTNPLVPDAKKGILAGQGPKLKARIVALDAATGKPRWSYALPPWHGAALGDDRRPDICLPDAFSNPAIGGDGTVYVGFQSGLLYSVRDDDADDSISEAEVSTFQTGAAFQGSPAIAPGMLVATPCDGMHVWRLNGTSV